MKRSLTPRELDVLDGWASGMTNREIAADLRIGIDTISKYGRRAKLKLGSRTAPQAVLHAIRLGILETEDYAP